MTHTLFQAAVCALLLVLPCTAAEYASPKGSTVQQVEVLRIKIETVKELEAARYLTATNSQRLRQWYQSQAERIAGYGLEQTSPKRWTEKLKFFSFINIVIIVAAIIGVVALLWLMGEYLMWILLHIPKLLWESLVWAICLYGMFRFHTLWITLPASLLILGAVGLTYFFHEEKLKSIPESVVSALVCVLWASAAWYQQSGVIAFIAVIAFAVSLGFSAAVHPLCYAIGFSSADKIPRAVTAAFVLIVLGLIMHVCRGRSDFALVEHHVGIFETGFLFVGCFVYFLGLLILGSWLYAKHNYWLMQCLIVLSGAAALYLGTLLELNSLRGIGGTFLGLYLLEKYTELAFRKVKWAWALLGLSALLYGVAMVARAYPAYFILHF